MSNKLESYNKATEKLVLYAADMEVPQLGKFSLPEMVFLLRESFKYKLTYKKVFNEIPGENWCPSTGFCLVSSYYIYEKTGGSDLWKIKKTPLHWWLEHKEYSGAFDVTYDQFNEPHPYRMGIIESRIEPENDPIFTEMLKEKAMILGRAAGME